MARSILKVLCIWIIMCVSSMSFSEPRINGFISAGGGKSSDIDFSGYEEDDWTFKADTILGIQVTAPVNDKVTATGQVIATGEDDYDAEVSWAYISYAFNDEVTGRIGRFRIPFYLYSDFLDVGYAYHWIRPPSIVYSLPFDSIDGIDVVYNTFLGDWDSSLQFYLGSLDDDFRQSGIDIETRLRSFYGISWTMTWEWLTLRASYHEADVSFTNIGDIANDALPGGTVGGFRDFILANAATFDMFQPGSSATVIDAANSLTEQEVNYQFIEFAAKVEIDNWLVVAEITELENDGGWLSENDRWYVSAGYRYGKFMPHITFSEADDPETDLTSGIPVVNPAIDMGLTSGVVGGLDGLTSSSPLKREITTVGVRYDFADSTAFKIEWSDIDNDSGEDGELISFVVDVVF